MTRAAYPFTASTVGNLLSFKAVSSLETEKTHMVQSQANGTLLYYTWLEIS